MGSMDRYWGATSSFDCEETARNINEIVQGARALDKLVIVVPPIIGPGKQLGNMSAQDAATHRALEDKMRSAALKTIADGDSGSTTKDNQVVITSDVGAVFNRRQEYYYAADGVHLSSRGYKYLAQHVLQAVLDRAVSLEWNINRALLCSN